MKALCGMFFLLATSGVFAEEAVTPRMIAVEAHFIRATDKQVQQAMAADGGRTPVSLDFSNQLLSDSTLPAGIAGGNGILSVQGILLEGEAGKILVKLKKAGAVVIGSPQAITLSGHRATLENVRELRYPSKFSDPSKESGEVIPIAFETKPVGITVQFEPKAGAGEGIDLMVNPRVVEFLGFIDYSGMKPGDKAPQPEAYEEMLKGPLKGGGVWQPVFTTREVTTTVTLYNGQTLLMGESGKEPRLLILLTASLVPEK